MKNRDYYLNQKRKKRNHSLNSYREERNIRKKRIFFLILIFVMVAGTGIAVLNMDDLESKNPTTSMKDQKKGQDKQLEEHKESGPYGIWDEDETKPTEAITEPITTQPKLEVDTRIPTKVKGIYVRAERAERQADTLIKLLNDTELNTMIIDIKDDNGYITYHMDNPMVKEMKATQNYITDIQALIKKLKEKNIYIIARVVTFKDPVLAEHHPELALYNKDGTIFRDKDHLAWVNPYKKEVWDYIVSVAKNCAAIGFDEVNFDYIRFSTDAGMSHVDFGKEAEQKTKIEAVTEFVKYAYEQLKPEGIFISADVYGAIINSSIDAKIVGQSYVEMSKYLDYICPMIYPSHYGNGCYGIDYPDTKPYELVMGALGSSRQALNKIPDGEHCAIVRPWLQDFTASWLKHHIKYGSKQIRDQIEAVYDAGYQEWLLWNADMSYTKSALYTESEAVSKYNARPDPTPTPEPTSAPTPTLVPSNGKYYDSPWKKEKEN